LLPLLPSNHLNYGNSVLELDAEADEEMMPFLPTAAAKNHNCLKQQKPQRTSVGEKTLCRSIQQQLAMTEREEVEQLIVKWFARCQQG
jgi:hypothetical protein